MCKIILSLYAQDARDAASGLFLQCKDATCWLWLLCHDNTRTHAHTRRL